MQGLQLDRVSQHFYPQRNRTAADLTVFNIFLVRDAGVDHYFDGFTAIWANDILEVDSLHVNQPTAMRLAGR